MNYAYGRYPEIFFDSSEASLPWRDFIPTSAISVAMTVVGTGFISVVSIALVDIRLTASERLRSNLR